MPIDDRVRELTDLKKTIATLKADLARCEKLLIECNDTLHQKRGVLELSQ